MIKGIVFDKDGTLLEYESFWIPVAEGAVKALLEAHNFRGALSDALNAIGAYDGIKGVLCHGTYGNIADALNNVLDGAPLTGDEVGKAFGDAVGLAKVTPTCKDIRKVFERFQSEGFTVALVTSDNKELTEHCLSELGISDMFDSIFTDDGVHPSKPNPYYMQRFCDEYGFYPQEVMMVGDTMTDIRFAQNSGAISVGVGRYAPELLAQSADYIIPDISHIFEVIGKHGGER